MKRVKNLMLFTMVFINTITQAQDLKEILNNHFERIGGVDKWRNLTTLKMRGNIEGAGLSYSVILYKKAINKVRQESTMFGTKTIKGYDGTDAWVSSNGQTISLSREGSKDLREQPIENEFIDYERRGYDVSYLGIKEINQNPCYEIQLTKKDEQEFYSELYYFDDNDYTLVMKSFVARIGQFTGNKIEVYYSDYRVVNGLLFPFKIEAKTNGIVAQRSIWDEITINEPLDDQLFSMPSPTSTFSTYSNGNYTINSNVVTIDNRAQKSSINIDSIMESVSAILKKSDVAGNTTVSNGVTIINRTNNQALTQPASKKDEWREEDYNKLVESLFSNLSGSSKLTEYKEKLGKRPFLTIGEIHNNTSFPIDVDGLIKKFEYRVFNSNILDIVESTAFRDKVRQERAEQSDFEKDEAFKKWGKEAGADLILFGELTVRTEHHKNKPISIYSISLFMTDVATNMRVWFGQEEVRR